MAVKNVGIRKLIGLVLHAIYATLKEIQWKNVEGVWINLFGGTFLKGMLANVVINRHAGDATTVTSTMLKVMDASAEIKKPIGVALIVIEISPKGTNATNVVIRKQTGIVKIVIGFHQKVMLVRNVIIRRLIGLAKKMVGKLHRVMLVKNVEVDHDLISKHRKFI